MATDKHERVEAFLASDPRQVWAVDRATGEPFYLPEGQAAPLRDFTKKTLKCPHPDCAVVISTKGGFYRDHFFHPSGTPHETSRESESHLAGKAMVTQWARTRVPSGAVVREEQSIKDPVTQALRRPDVLVTGTTGRRVAYEIEYKNWAIESWRRKQADLDRNHIACAWLVGHTRVVPAPDHGQRSSTTAPCRHDCREWLRRVGDQPSHPRGRHTRE